MSFFQKVREIFGLGTGAENPIDTLDGIVLEETIAIDNLNKAKADFNEIIDELEWKRKACDVLIQKGNADGEFNKSIVQKKIDKVTEDFTVECQALVSQLEEIQIKKSEIEGEISDRATEFVATLPDHQQAYLTDLLMTWRNTGMVDDVPVTSNVMAIVKAINVISDGFFEKALAAKVGDIREWAGGQKWQKTNKGWVKLTDKKDKKGEKEKKHSTQELIAHAENTSTEQLEKIAADKTKPAHVRDAAKREVERRNEPLETEQRKWKREDKVRAEDKKDAQKEKKEEQKAKEQEKADQKAKERKKAKEKAAKEKEDAKKPKRIKPDETFSGTMTLSKNTEKAPNMGSRFGQDVEPAGFYAIQKESDHLDDHPNYKTFTVDIKKPLIINTTKEGLIDWKRNLSGKYNAKGAKLSKKLMEEGYDSIITTDEYGYTGEIIVLNTERLKEVDLKKSDDDLYFEDISDIQKAKHFEYVKVTRAGKTFYQYREVGTEKIEHELPVGDHVMSDHLNLKITKYSDKSLLVTGDTYQNLELLRKIKSDAGIGSWNKTLNGWIFPLNAQSTIFSALIKSMPEATFEETIAKEQAIEMKNAVEIGATITVDGEEKQVEAVAVSETGEIQLETSDGPVTETQAGIVPVPDATQVINETNEENRFKTVKDVFGKEEGETPVSTDIDEKGQRSKPAEVKEFETRSGQKVDALDYTNLKQMDIQLVDQEDILDKPKPHWCPDINLAIFAGRKNDDFVFDYVKMGEDKYLLALNGYKKSIYGVNVSGHVIHNEALRKDLKEGVHSYLDLERPKNSWGNSKEGYTIEIGDKVYKYSEHEKDKFQADEYALLNNHNAQYAVVSIDQIVAMQDYYQKFAKAAIARKKEIETEKVLERMREWSDEKIAKYYPFDYDRRLSDKQRKKYTKEQWDALPKEAKIAEVPFMKHPAVELPTGKRISQLSEDYMKNSNFDMYKEFVDKSYLTPKDKNSRYYQHDDPCVIEYKEVRDQIQWRKIDLRLQREENDTSYEKGYQTSYGDVNTKDDLLHSHGVKIKLQNGKDVKEIHTEQIKEHLEKVYGSFGDRSNIAKEVGLKISHSGDKMMFARNALGIYSPSMKAIGVSDNKTHGKFGLTLAHEFAHFIDNYVGNKNGRHYASDNLNSTAGKIARQFREHMNEKSDSDYFNRTCECFARAFEQYHAIKTDGEGAIKSQKDLVPYSERAEHVSNEKFNKHVRPLIEEFLKENDHILKSMSVDFE